MLVVTRADDPRGGTWDLPGGFLEPGEEPVDALMREVDEELGVEFQVGAFLSALADEYDGHDRTVTLAYQGTISA